MLKELNELNELNDFDELEELDEQEELEEVDPIEQLLQIQDKEEFQEMFLEHAYKEDGTFDDEFILTALLTSLQRSSNSIQTLFDDCKDDIDKMDEDELELLEVLGDSKAAYDDFAEDLKKALDELNENSSDNIGSNES